MLRQPAHVDVYGADHSPWVQAVLLGLHEARVPHALTTAPPLESFLKNGVTMPAASIDGEPWMLESADILARAGYGPVSPEDLRALYGAWQGVLHRTDSAAAFWGGFSRIRDPHPNLAVRLWRHFRRSFATFYFFVLIRYSVFRGARHDPDSFVPQFRYWEERLEASRADYFGGTSPDITDMTLLGIIQCHCSIQHPPLISALQDDPALPRLRAWIGRMHVRLDGYQHLYSGALFKPRAPTPTPAPPLERAAFWAGAACMWLAAPVTLPLVVWFMSRRAQQR